MPKYKVGYHGSRHEAHIEAKTMKEAKAKFAKQEGVPSNSGYIKASKISG